MAVEGSVELEVAAAERGTRYCQGCTRLAERPGRTTSRQHHTSRGHCSRRPLRTSRPHRSSPHTALRRSSGNKASAEGLAVATRAVLMVAMVALVEPMAGLAELMVATVATAGVVARTPHTPQTQHAQLRNRW